MAEIVEVRVPHLEAGMRATVVRWWKAAGDHVAKDETLVELETDKITVEIPSPIDGRLIEIRRLTNASVSSDEVLATLGATAPHTPEVTLRGSQAQDLSPAVRRLLDQHGIAPGDIEGTGRGNRITADDVTRHVARVAGVTRVPHTAMRRRESEHMVRSLLEAPHVTTLFEADLTQVLAHKARHAAEYEARGARLTLTAYFVSACARALQSHKEVNASFRADALELHPDANIGVGAALGEKGVIVPVIHRAQLMNLFGIAQRLGQLVQAARAGSLQPEDVRGGTFTISNHGVTGSLLAAPIVINQPQVAIMGIGKVERRVRVVEVHGAETIAVRSVCYVTMTIDHRVLGAFQANSFLGSVVSTIEHWPEDDGPE